MYMMQVNEETLRILGQVLASVSYCPSSCPKQEVRSVKRSTEGSDIILYVQIHNADWIHYVPLIIING